jgi:hypothetical protein
LPLTPDPIVPAPHDHVTRSKRHGQWRHWFTPEDVASFRPLMEPYLRQYGYSTDWTLAPDPVIRPDEASEYVVRPVRLGRRRRSLPRRILVRLAGGGR